MHFQIIQKNTILKDDQMLYFYLKQLQIIKLFY